jgi:2-C-methyl-D-erythritol 4-phosphate cytidylyltransferase
VTRSDVSVVVAAAGRGDRLGAGVPKAFVTFGGRPLVLHTVRRLAAAEAFESAVIAAPAALVATLEDLLAAEGGWPFAVRVVGGGRERQDSVRRALAEVSDGCRIVVIHDAVRPFVSAEIVRACVAAARVCGAAVAAVPAKDTLKRVQGDLVVATVDRAGLWQAQTPQAFDATLLREAHRRAAETGYDGTDDAALVERAGVCPRVVPGDPLNIKITTPADLRYAEALLSRV